MNTPKGFIVLGAGDLFRERDIDYGKPFRPRWSFTFRRITKAHEVASTLRGGPYAWPGGYPLFFITRDGAALCFACVRKEWRHIVADMISNRDTGWKVEACDVNWEDPDCICDHCSQRIESAYAEKEAKAP